MACPRLSRAACLLVFMAMASSLPAVDWSAELTAEYPGIRRGTAFAAADTLLLSGRATAERLVPGLSVSGYAIGAATGRGDPAHTDLSDRIGLDLSWTGRAWSLEGTLGLGAWIQPAFPAEDFRFFSAEPRVALAAPMWWGEPKWFAVVSLEPEQVGLYHGFEGHWTWALLRGALDLGTRMAWAQDYEKQDSGDFLKQLLLGNPGPALLGLIPLESGARVSYDYPISHGIDLVAHLGAGLVLFSTYTDRQLWIDGGAGLRLSGGR